MPTPSETYLSALVEITAQTLELAEAAKAASEAAREQARQMAEVKAAAQLVKDLEKEKAEALKAVNERLQAMTAATAAVVGAAVNLANPLTTLTNVLGAPVAALQSMTAGIQGFVLASNPAEMMRFRFALQDLSASVGRIFEPVIEAVAQLADIFNRVFTEIGPTLTPVMQQFGQIVREVGGVLANAMRPVLQALAPVLQTVMGLFQQLVPVFTPVIQAIGGVVSDLLRAFNPLLQAVVPSLVQALQWLANAVVEATVHIRTTVENPQGVAQTLAQVAAGIVNQNPAQIGLGVAGYNVLLEQTRERIRQEMATQPVLPPNQTTAARPAQMLGSVDQLGEQARLAAFGARSQAELQQEANGLLGRAVNFLDTIAQAVNQFGLGNFEQAGQGFAGAVQQALAGEAGI